MQAFIKNRNTFATTSHELVLDYDIKKSIYDVVSKIVVETPATLPQENDFIYLEDLSYVGIIKTVTVNESKTELKVNQALTLFDREIFFEEESFTYGEDYLKSLIDTNFTNCTDSTYAMSFLSVVVDTHTSATAIPDVEKNVFQVKSYASKLRRLYGIECIFSMTRTQLVIHIKRPTVVTKNIDFSNPQYKLDKENFSEKIIGKVTTYCKESTKSQNWYYWDDGSITHDAEVNGSLWALQHQDLTFTDVVASTWTAWTPDTLRTGYGYKCELSLRGVTENHLAEITLDPTDANSACIHSIPTTSANKVILYSNTSGISITIPQICCQLT